MPRIVTEAYIYDPDTMLKVSEWARVIQEQISQKNILLSDDIELFIQIEGTDCAYYFANHSTRTEFWLEELDTDDLGLPAVVSPSHLRQFALDTQLHSRRILTQRGRNSRGGIILGTRRTFSDAFQRSTAKYS